MPTLIIPDEMKKFRTQIKQLEGMLALYQGEVRTFSLSMEKWVRISDAGDLKKTELGSDNWQFTLKASAIGDSDCGIFSPYYEEIECVPDFSRPVSTFAVEDELCYEYCFLSVKCVTFAELFHATMYSHPFQVIVDVWNEGRIVARRCTMKP